MDKSNRLEQYLRFREDRARLLLLMELMGTRAGQPAFELAPCERQMHAMRQLLLKVATMSDEDALAYEEPFKAFAEEPLLRQLVDWCMCSRRVFRPHADLALELLHTTLGGANLTEIPFPFESFVIELDEPLIDRVGRRFDAILFSGLRGGSTGRTVLSFQLFSDILDVYAPIGRNKWRKFEIRAMNASKREALRLELNPLWYERLRPMRASSVCMSAWIAANGQLELSEDSYIPATVQGVVDMADMTGIEDFHVVADAMKAAIRITLGLCLYLNGTGSRRHAVRSQRNPIPAPGTFSISDAAEVFEVTYEHTLSPEEREILKGLPIDDRAAMTSHFRRGYWSRPPGKGDDPQAKKTVWHRPTIVRRDLLAAGTLPLGAVSKVR